MGVDSVQLVAMRSTVFCVVCNLSMCVSVAFESMGLMYCLYICNLCDVFLGVTEGCICECL